MRNEKCKGCVDFNVSVKCCDFLNRHERVRPVPMGRNGGCALKAQSWAKQAKLEKQCAWSARRARLLLDQGKSVKAVAKEVGATQNAIRAMLNGKTPPEEPEAPPRRRRLRGATRGCPCDHAGTRGA